MELVKFTTNRSIKDGIEIAKQRIKDSLYIFEKYSNSFIKRDCPCCGYDKYKEFDRFHDTYLIVKCIRCGTLFVNPCPGRNALADYYSNCLSNTLNCKMWEKRKNKKTSNYLFDEQISSLAQLIKEVNSKPIKILEVGSGSGTFLEQVKSQFSEKDVDLLGIDLDKNAVKIAQEKGLKVIYGDVESFIEKQSTKFHIILHFALIEHLIFPRIFLKNCYRLLSDRGFLMFTTCNGEGLDNKSIGYNWPNRMIAHPLFPPMHLNCFNTRNIYYLLLNLGFKIVQISTPGKLDVEIIKVHDSSDVKATYRFILDLPEDKQLLIQNLISDLNASGHMLVLARK